MGLIPKWVKELDIGEYFEDVRQSLIRLSKKTGETLGAVTSGMVGGVLKKIWLWLILALIIFLLYLAYKTGFYKRIFHE